jgi:hypothetical protein
MRKTAIITMLSSILLLLLPGLTLFAQYDSSAVEEDMQNIAQGISELFGENVGSLSMIGDPIGYSTIPRFEVGIAAGAVFVPLENISTGEDTLYDTGGLAYTPVPSIAAHMKVNIKGFEVGAKLAGIPPFQFSNGNLNGEMQNTIIGGKLRYEIVDKKVSLLRFGVSAGGFYEYTKGNMAMQMTESFEVYEEVNPMQPGEEHIANLVSSNAFDSDWKGHTVGAELQGNMKIAFFNIFLGGRLSTSWGSAQTTIDGDVTVSPESGYEGYVTANPSEPIDIATDASPDGLGYYGFGGLEFKILPIVVGGRLGYNFRNDVITADFGARLQF